MIGEIKGTRIIVCGTRSFDDYELLEETLDKALARINNPIIVQGGAKGADQLADQYAFKKRVPMQVFHADWKKHGKVAGPIRNGEMVRRASRCVAFWDGTSPGTKNMIAKARKRGLKIKVIRYDLIPKKPKGRKLQRYRKNK